ncbi:trypsin-like peptidase domain-containing protein [Streptomyces pimonensis]|uniref:Trypsin-like peptidase domain-containing protein n=1 Tax=Streptomyces pimonensis TaxID=2860288 RepID=A0ABV4ISN6_9ACTN
MNEGKPGPPEEEPATRPEGHGGDFELARPDRRSAAAAGHRGDHEPDRPPRSEGSEDRSVEPVSGASTTALGASGSVAPGAPADESAVSGSPVVPAPVVPDPPPVASEPPASERRRPLHDPDPYSTPPYGEPGPWAPAPPVQHPTTTSTHGMALTPPPAVQDATPPSLPPSPPTALQGPPAPHEAPMTHGAPTGPPAAPVPTPLGAPAPHGTPAVPEAGTHGVLPAPVMPAPAHPEAQAPPDSRTPPAQDAPVADPWRRYDPWAAAAATAPLQQTGQAVAGRKRRRGRVLVGAALLLALVSGGIGGIVGAYLERNGGVGTVELPQAGEEAPERDPGSVAGIAARALPSVVTLHVSGAGEAGTGTGFVLDERGHILTNDHVVGPAGDDGEITVTFHSGDTAEATVVGRDGGYDLAVVRVKGVSGLTPLPLGNSDNVRVGDPVVAIGAPFDLAGTVTSGIISARERPITAGGEKGDGSDVSYVDALQTDAPINPGNSGGPLLDARARVIGINSAIRSADGGADPDAGQAGSIGLGFAIPINQGKRVAEELINTGRAAHPVIGITLDMEYGGDGARVAAQGSDGGPPVSTGGPGARAGIRAGDVITEVDGRRVRSGEELIVKTRAHRPGDRLELTLERDGEERTVALTLGSSEGD